MFNPHTPAYRAEILSKWNSANLNTVGMGKEAVNAAKMVVKFKPLYDPVEAATGVPWWIVGPIDCREESFRHDKNLCNGDPLNQRTTHVPRGVGPFKTWTEGAIFAMHYDRLTASDLLGWLIEAERYNGEGYHNHPDPSAPSHPEPSPYLWSGTSVYHRGKYSGDGVWDPNLVDQQPGVGAIVKALIAFNGLVIPSIGTP